jgi:phosphoribosylformylglycinamidine synthase subunit PurL
VFDFIGGRPAPVDLDAERRLQRLLIEAARRRLLRSAHDASEGGLAVALAEAAMGGAYARAGLGAAVTLDQYAPGLAADGLLYGEDGARAVVTTPAAEVDALMALAREGGVPAFRAGRVGQPDGELELRVGSELFTWSIGALRLTYFTAIPRRMQQPDVDRSAGA